MPFCLVNSSNTLARYMADLFRDLKFICIFFNDILIFSNSKEGHWQHIDAVLSPLQKKNLWQKESTIPW